MSEKLENAFAGAIGNFVTNRLAPLLQQELGKELAEAAAASGAAGASSSGKLSTAYFRIAGARSQTETMQSLLDATSDFAARSAVFVVKGDKLTGWRARGFEGDSADRVREINLAADGDAGWRRALAEQAATTGSVETLPQALSRSLFESIGSPSDGKGYLLPLLVRDRPVGALYADCGASGGVPDLAALDLLVRLSGLCIELAALRQRPGTGAAPSVAGPAATETPEPEQPLMAAVPEPEAVPPPPAAAPPPPAPAPAPAAGGRAPGPDFDNIPPADHDVHRKAFRSAKLLVDDLILYNKDKIEQGKANRDVYNTIKEDIDKSRAHYGKKWAGTAAAGIDYFHQELMRRVANNDPGILGSEYPGPLV